MNIKSLKLPASWKIFWALLGIALVTFFLSFHSGKQSPQKKVASIVNPTTYPSPSPEISPETTDEVSPAVKKISKNTVVITTPAPAQSSTNSGGSTSQSSQLHVDVSITGVSGFSLDVSPGANQCEVLTKAQSDGKINSLNMRFNSDLGSSAVYQINGLGKDNAVWWTYKVNGQSPSQGCSYIKVNNGDKVEWNYIGS